VFQSSGQTAQIALLIYSGAAWRFPASCGSRTKIVVAETKRAAQARS